MNKKVTGVILAVLLAAWVILAAYFFFSTGISISLFQTPNVMPLLETFLTLNFVVFIIAAAAGLALILVLGKKYPFKEAMFLSYIGYFAGIAVSLMLFPRLVEFIVPLVFMAAGIPLGMRYLAEKEREVKYLQNLRAGTSGAGRIVLAAVLGLFIYLALVGYLNQAEFEQNFVPEFLSMTVGSNMTVSQQMGDQLSSAIAQQQAVTIGQIQELAPMQNLVQKNDPDGQQLFAILGAMKTQVSSQAYVDNISAQMQQQKIDVGGQLVRQFPMIQTMAKYSWIIFALEAIVLALFVSNLVVKNLAALIYAGIIMVYPKAGAAAGKVVEQKAVAGTTEKTTS